MPVYKYKTFEDADKALWLPPLDDRNFDKLVDYFNFLDKLHPIRFRAGVYKFKSLRDANEHRREQEANFALKIYNERFENNK